MADIDRRGGLCAFPTMVVLTRDRWGGIKTCRQEFRCERATAPWDDLLCETHANFIEWGSRPRFLRTKRDA